MAAAIVALSRPINQDRLNAAVFELLRLRFTGAVWLPGEGWDCEETVRYLGTRSRRCSLISWLSADGTLGAFRFGDKRVSFAEDGVLIETRPPSPAPTDYYFHCDGQDEKRHHCCCCADLCRAHISASSDLRS